MPNVVVTLLEQSKAHRSSAERARRLADGMTTASVVQELNRYAAELERKAHELEEHADIRAAIVEKTDSLGAEIESLLADSHARRSEKWAGLG